MVFIIALTLVAILGYLIMPDSSPLANNMTIQLSLKKPGSEFMMLHLRKTEKVDTVNLFTKMLFGQLSFYRDIPITGYHFTKDSVIVDEYIGTEDKPERKSYSIKSSISPSGNNATIIHKTFWLGTDIYGRDMLSRLILGTRISLSVGLMAVIISMLLGVTIGSIAGYFGGWIDACLSWLMNILWSLPALLLVIAIAIKWESGWKGDIIYSSFRAGRGFKIFKFYKFRTMIPDADKKLSELADLNIYDNNENETTAFFKVINDPRITKIGSFLRNSSLDELPQLFNVLKGDMSIVGNRPLPLYEAASLTTDEWAERFMAPAGITGLWQISKRGNKNMSTEERIALDIDYARHQSLKADLLIMLKTPTALIQKSNV